MKYLIPLSILFLSITSNAQIRFNKYFDFNYDEWQQNLIIDHQGNYVGIGWSQPYGTNSTVMLAKYDNNGNLIDTSRYKNLGLNIFPSWRGSILQHTITHDYFCSGQAQWYDTSVIGGSRSQALLIRYKENGDTLFLKHWGDSTEFFNASSISQYDDSTFILGAAVGHDMGVLTPLDFYLAKLDTAGNLIWQKRYLTSVDDYLLNFFISDDKQKIYTAGGRFTDPVFNKSKPVFKKVDSSGNLLMSVEWSDSSYSHGALIMNRHLQNPSRPDQLMVICGIDTMYDEAGQTLAFYNVPQVSGIDTNFNTIWKKIFYKAEERIDWYYAKPVSNGRIMVVGSKLLGSNLQWYGWALLLNDIGDVIWERTYFNRPDALHYFSDFQECPDGGFVFTGELSNTSTVPTSDAWLVKVDSLGCEVPNCSPMGVLNQSLIPKPWSIYPNPCQQSLRISFESIPDPNSNIVLYDMLGRKIFDKQFKNSNILQRSSTEYELNTSFLKNGMYFLQIGNRTEKITKE